MSKVAVIYWSSTGNTQAMAEAVAQGATSAGAETDLKAVAEFDPQSVANYDAIAFGCPAMGAEVLEEAEFDPAFIACEGLLAGKKVGLFGSYGWGDGTWMRDWETRCRNDGADLVSDGVICMEAPDAGAVAECEALGKALA